MEGGADLPFGGMHSILIENVMYCMDVVVCWITVLSVYIFYLSGECTYSDVQWRVHTQCEQKESRR